MLFLHGYLSEKESFFYQIEELSQKFLCVAPDFPCFGASSSTDSAWSVGDYALWLKDFISCEGLYGADIIAHSFGARVAIKLISGDNAVCKRLVITGGAGIVKSRSAAYMRQVKRYRAVKKFFPRFAERHFGSSEYRSLSPMMKESYKKIVNEDLRECAAKIFNQTLLIYGSEDTVTPIGEEGRIFNSVMPRSRLIETVGGHFCFSEHKEEFNKLLLNFLSAQE